MNKLYQTLKIVIVGHVDHGKSTLIGRLLFDTDSLPEEKIKEIKETSQSLGKDTEFAFLMDHFREEREKEMTIDTAQIFFRTQKRNYVIIDAPGHVEFIKNMITGATHADTSILVVSAEEGVEEQTKRHAYLLKMLDIKNVIVVINKMDMVGYSQNEFNLLKEKVEEFLSSIDLHALKIIPISAKEGDNVVRRATQMPWYSEGTLLQTLDSVKSGSEDSKILRFSIQDTYNINHKKVFVGRVDSGQLQQGRTLRAWPSNKEVTIESIIKFNKNLKKAISGECVGIVIREQTSLARGEIICAKEDCPLVTDSFKASIFWMAQEPLKLNQTLTFKCVTQETSCEVERIERKIDSSTPESLENNAQNLLFTQIGEVMIKTKQPVVIDDFNTIKNLGRFVLESNHDAVAGGIFKLR